MKRDVTLSVSGTPDFFVGDRLDVFTGGKRRRATVRAIRPGEIDVRLPFSLRRVAHRQEGERMRNRLRVVWHVLRGRPTIAWVEFNGGISVNEKCKHVLVDSCVFRGGDYGIHLSVPPLTDRRAS